MVYESDFSTRRVYSGSSRPISTSYSSESSSWSLNSSDGGITLNAGGDNDFETEYFQEIAFLPQLILPFDDFPAAARRRPDLFVNYAPISRKGRKQQHRVIVPLPRIVHQRLIPVSAPPRRHHPTNVYDALECGRSGNQYVLMSYRPTPPPIPVPRSRVMYIEDITNSNFQEIDRETRSMHRDMDAMLYRVATGIPRSMTPAPYSMHHIPMRSASEVKEVADLRRLYVRDRNPGLVWGPMTSSNVFRIPITYRPDPATVDSKYYYIGRQNLACLSFAGGRPIPKRRRFYPGYEDKIMDEVTVRSYYTKLRNAANSAANAARKYLRSTQYQPLHYSRKTILGEDAPKREIQESKWVQRAMANTKEPTKKPEATKLEPVKETPARRESLTKEPKLEPPPPARPINVTLPGPRKSVTEIIKEDMPKVENLPEESVTVRRPSKMETVPATPPVDAKTEETFILPIKPKEPTPPPPKEPTPPPPEAPAAMIEEIVQPSPKEPTPPPPEVPAAVAQEEVKPPAKEPTPPPPVAPTVVQEEVQPPPKEPTPPPPEAAAAAVVQEEVQPGDVSEEGAVEGSDTDSNKGEIADIPLDEEEVTVDAEAEHIPDALPQVETNGVTVEESPVEVSPEEISPPTAVENDESLPQPPPTENDESLPPPPEIDEAPAASEELAQEEIPEVEEAEIEGEAPIGVSILVADVDGPMHVDAEDSGPQKPMTVEQIQAEAERRRAEFARLLEEHHEIVEKVDKLEHQTDVLVVDILEPIPESPVPHQTPEEGPLLDNNIVVKDDGINQDREPIPESAQHALTSTD